MKKREFLLLQQRLAEGERKRRTTYIVPHYTICVLLVLQYDSIFSSTYKSQNEQDIPILREVYQTKVHRCMHIKKPGAYEKISVLDQGRHAIRN